MGWTGKWNFKAAYMTVGRKERREGGGKFKGRKEKKIFLVYNLKS